MTRLPIGSNAARAARRFTQNVTRIEAAIQMELKARPTRPLRPRLLLPRTEDPFAVLMLEDWYANPHEIAAAERLLLDEGVRAYGLIWEGRIEGTLRKELVCLYRNRDVDIAGLRRTHLVRQSGHVNFGVVRNDPVGLYAIDERNSASLDEVALIRQSEAYRNLHNGLAQTLWVCRLDAAGTAS